MVMTITVDLGERSYPIHIGSGLLDRGFDLAEHIAGPDCLVVSNPTVAALYLDALKTCLGDSKPAWVTRSGPSRSPVSAPFLKSKTSLAKLVPT